MNIEIIYCQKLFSFNETSLNTLNFDYEVAKYHQLYLETNQQMPSSEQLLHKYSFC